MRSRIFWAFFIALIILAILHNIAVALFLYWTYAWFDILMHILGGAVVALGYSAVTLSSRAILGRFVSFGLMPVLAAVLIVGLSWEVFEVMIGIPFDEHYTVDTTIDIAADISGALVGYYTALYLSRQV